MSAQTIKESLRDLGALRDKQRPETALHRRLRKPGREHIHAQRLGKGGDVGPFGWASELTARRLAGPCNTRL